MSTTSPSAQTATTSPARSASAAEGFPWVTLINGAVALGAIVVVLVLVRVCLAQLGSGQGAESAIAMVTSAGAIVVGVVGAYFGVNIAHSAQSQAAAATQRSTTQAVQTVQDQTRTAVAAAAALDPQSPEAQRLLEHLR